MALFERIFSSNRTKVALIEEGVRLVALTPEMEEAFKGSELTVSSFPFRIGRETRLTERSKQWSHDHDVVSFHNDLEICDRGSRLNISREHLEIRETRPGQYELLNQRSACGTIVDGERLGGKDMGGRRPLKHRDIVIIGTSSSPFMFRFEVLGERKHHQLVNAIAGLGYLRDEGMMSDDTYKERVEPLKQRL